MILKRLTDENVLEHEKLASQAFVFPYDEAEATALPSDIMLGAFTPDGKLAADMEIYDRVCCFDGGLLTCAAVGGVASKPEYRRMGAVREMLTELENGDILGKKWDISILYPFSAAYYKKFGYAPVGTKLRVRIPFTQLNEVPRSGSVRLYEPGTDDAPRGIYNAAAKKRRLAFRRDDAQAWDRDPYSTGTYTYLWHGADGIPRSYAVFSLNRDKSEVNVSETVFEDKASLLGILGFLRSFDGNFDHIVFECLPADTPILYCISDINKAQITCSPVGAVRLLDPLAVLERRVWPEIPGRFTLGIGDLVFDVAYRGGRADVNRTDGTPDAALGQTAAAKLLTEGLRSERELAFLPDAAINGDVGDLIRAFPFEHVFFCDHF